jgi:hypothetical protein
MGMSRMRNKKDWVSLNVQPPVASINQECLTAKESAIRDAVAALKPITTFAAIGEQISYSRQYVSKEDARAIRKRSRRHMVAR